MPFIRNLWIATLTSTASDAGSDDELVVIINQDGLDVVHKDLSFGDVETGGGKLYRHDISEARVRPEEHYMRIGIRGDDAWVPRMVAAWGERLSTGNVVPLGYDEELDIVLSTDSSEGRISMPVRRLTPGMVRTQITRIMLVTGTNIMDSATDSDVRVRISVDGSAVVDTVVPDTPQDDFEGAEGNVYFLPVTTPFTRSQLDEDSIVLSIEGDDAWLPMAVMMFGLDADSGNPGRMVPLAHAHPWGFGWMSTDPDEGVSSVTLSLAPID